MKLKTVLLTALLTLSMALPAAAAQWQADPAHSNVYFGIKHIFATINGKFDAFQADVDLDPKAPEKGSIVLTIKTTSVDTDIEKRDEHLRTQDFFEVATYPEIVFKSTAIKPTGKDAYDVTGDLTIKGKTHTVTVPMTLAGPTADPFNPDRQVLGLDSRFTVDRLDYGVGNGQFFKMGILDRKVDMIISMELVR